MIPQIIYLVILVLTLGYALVKDGEPKTGKYSFFSSLIAGGIEIALLWWGGFFR